MKKLFVLLLTLILSLSTLGLIGCGNIETPPPGGETPPLEDVVEGTKGLKYSIIKQGKEEIACFTGISNECTEKNIVIASHYNGVKVTEIGIGSYALSSINKVESVKVHKYVKKINSSAFNKAENLVKIEFDKDCKLEEISSSAFKNCSKLTTFNYSGTIGVFGDAVFEGCTSLPTTEYKGAKYIGFSGNPYLILTEGIDEESCVINKGCLLIKENAFKGYKNLKSVTFESNNTLTSIGNEAFSESNIEEITIPESVVKIGNKAFYQCLNLVRVIFSENSQCKIIQPRAFGACENLEEVVNFGKTKLETIEDALFANDKLTSSKTKLRSIDIPSTVKVIKDNVFFKSTLLVEVNIPKDNSLEQIGNQAFRNCNIKQLVIPETVTDIGWDAFSWNYGLKLFCEAPKVPEGRGWYPDRWNRYNTNLGNVIQTTNPEAFCDTYFFSATQKSGKYWRYVNGEPTPW